MSLGKQGKCKSDYLDLKHFSIHFSYKLSQRNKLFGLTELWLAADSHKKLLCGQLFFMSPISLLRLLTTHFSTRTLWTVSFSVNTVIVKGERFVFEAGGGFIIILFGLACWPRWVWQVTDGEHSWYLICNSGTVTHTQTATHGYQDIHQAITYTHIKITVYTAQAGWIFYPPHHLCSLQHEWSTWSTALVSHCIASQT